jgi:hypothetical protein
MPLPTPLHERVAILDAGIGRSIRSDEALLFAIVGFGALSIAVGACRERRPRPRRELCSLQRAWPSTK